MRHGEHVLPWETSIGYMPAVLMDGFRETVAALWQACGRRVYLTAYHILRDRALAEEVCSDAFARYLDAAPHRAEDVLRQGPGFVLVTARHLAISMRRHRGVAFVPLDTDPVDVGATAEGPIDRERLGRALCAAIEGLPAQRRTIFEMRMLEERSYADIGAALGLLEGTARKNFFDTCRALRVPLEAWRDRARKET